MAESALLQQLPEGASRLLDAVQDGALGSVGTGQLVGTIIVVLFLGATATSAGVGGGGLFVPTYIFLLGVSPKSAVPLSKATILGGSIGKFIQTARAKHPTEDRPLISYELATFVQATELLGSIFGVVLNLILPDIVLTVALVIILLISGRKTVLKGLKARKKESDEIEQAERLQAEKEKADEEAGPTQPDAETASAKAAAATSATEMVAYNGTGNGHNAAVLLGGGSNAGEEGKNRKGDDTQSGSHPMSKSGEAEQKADTKFDANVNAVHADEEAGKHVVGTTTTTTTGADNATAISSESTAASGANDCQPDLDTLAIPDNVPTELREKCDWILANEKKQFPPFNFGLLLTMCIFVIIYSLIRGGVVGNLEACTAGYWAFSATPIPFYGICAVGIGWRLLAHHTVREQCGIKYPENDLVWNTATLKKFPVIAFTAGLAAGMLGIGGGMILGPLFLELNLVPQVSTATTAFLILFTSISSVSQYLSLGALHWKFALTFSSVGCIGGLIGSIFLKKMLDKTGRPSYIILLLGGFIAVSTVAIVVSGIIAAVGSSGDLFEFDSSSFTCS